MENEIVAAPNDAIAKIKELHQDSAFASECRDKMKELRTTTENYTKTLNSLDDAIHEANYSLRQMEKSKRSCKKSLSELLIQLSQE